MCDLHHRPYCCRGGDERDTSSRAFRVAGIKAFAEAGITHDDVEHLMIYDAARGKLCT